MDFKTTLLTEFLDCGYADIDFLETTMKDLMLILGISKLNLMII